MSIDVDDLYKPLNPATKSLKPRVRVRALQESQGHLLRGDQDSGHLRRKRSAAIALLLLRSAGEHCDSVSLAEAKAKKKVAHCDSVSPEMKSGNTAMVSP